MKKKIRQSRLCRQNYRLDRLRQSTKQTSWVRNNDMRIFTSSITKHTTHFDTGLLAWHWYFKWLEGALNACRGFIILVFFLLLWIARQVSNSKNKDPSVLEVEIWSQMVDLRTAEIFKVVLRYAVRHGQVRSHVRLNRNLLMNLPLWTLATTVGGL